jgi:predicted RNA binding protein YcfA (HicA-like mRNA interferase family)
MLSCERFGVMPKRRKESTNASSPRDISDIGVHSMETNRKKIIARLERDGWKNVDGTKHDKFRHSTKASVIYVPRHVEIKKFVAQNIAKAAGWKEK